MKWDEITGGLGERFELLLNTYKPFACGIVMHPTIDACLQLRAEHRLTADQIERIDLAVHPLVLELTGKRTPQTGLEAKFSIYTAAALAIVAGAPGRSSSATISFGMPASWRCATGSSPPSRPASAKPR